MIKSLVLSGFLFCAGLLCLAQAQIPLTGAGLGSTASASYIYVGTGSSSVAGNTANITITGLTPGYLVVGVTTQSGDALSSVSANGTALNADVPISVSPQTGIWSGVALNTGTTITLVCQASCGFISRTVWVWNLQNLKNNNVQHTANGTSSTQTISVAAGDFLFSICVATTSCSWASSTQAPARSDTGTHADADWTIASTNASFTVGGATGTIFGITSASYH
jgi:hypothetical protein